MAVNAQGSGPDAPGIWTIISMVEEFCPHWSAIFVSESDFLETSRDLVDIGPHCSWRHWNGAGSRAMRWILRSDRKHLLNSGTWQGRAGALSLVSNSSGNARELNLVGLHAANGEILYDSLSDCSVLLARCKPCSKVLVCGDWNIDLLPISSITLGLISRP